MNTPESLDTTAPVVEKKSRWEDYIDVFFSPAELFERRRDDKLFPPLITLLLLATVFYFILLPGNIMMREAAMTPDQQAALSNVSANAGKILSIIGGVMVPIMYLIMTAVTAGCLWLLARLVDADPTFHDMMIVATYAGFIALLGSIAATVAVMIHGAAGLDAFRHTSFGVMRFVDRSSMPAALVPVLMRIDVFKIWQAVVWAIGFRVVTGASKEKSALVAGVLWFAAAVPGLIASGKMAKMGQVQMKTGA